MYEALHAQCFPIVCEKKTLRRLDCSKQEVVGSYPARVASRLHWAGSASYTQECHQSIDEFQINEINVDLRTSGFDNEVLSVDACAVWWERESFYCLPRIGVVTWHREPRFQCGSARTGSIWNSSIGLHIAEPAAIQDSSRPDNLSDREVKTSALVNRRSWVRILPKLPVNFFFTDTLQSQSKSMSLRAK